MPGTDFEPAWERTFERDGHARDADVAITAMAAREFAALSLLGGQAPEYLGNDGSLFGAGAHVRSEEDRAGGIYSSKPAVRDGKRITALTWKCRPEFYQEPFACLERH